MKMSRKIFEKEVFFSCFKFELIAFCGKKIPKYFDDPNHNRTQRQRKKIQIQIYANKLRREREKKKTKRIVIWAHLNHSILRMTSDITLFNTL